MRSGKIELQLLRRKIFGAKRVVVYARAPLIAFLRERLVSMSASPRLILTGIIEGESHHEPMCRFTVEGDGQRHFFVAPLSQLSFGRGGQFSNALARKTRIDCWQQSSRVIGLRRQESCA